jgi:uncharacterized protein
MKYLVLVLVLLLVIWLAKAKSRPARGRSVDPSRPPRQAGRRAPGEDGEVMLACAHCGVMLPRGETLPGRGGVFCSEAHRTLAESRDGG